MVQSNAGKYYALYIIAILAVIIVLSVPFFLSYDNYGTWKEIEGRCEGKGDRCEDGGVRVTEKRCIPNPTSGYGCLKDGRMTFNTQYVEEDCAVSCFKSEWDIPKVGPCVDNVRTVEYNCIPRDESGPNGCLRIEDFVSTYYPPGYSYTKEFSCKSENLIGRWVITDEDVPFDTWIRGKVSTIKVNNTYDVSNNCSTLDGKILSEGTIRYKLACVYGDKWYIPSDQTGNSSPQCTTEVPSTLDYCRYLPNDYSFLVPTIQGRGLSLANLPGNSASVAPFISNINEGTFDNYASREVISSNFGPMEGCTADMVLEDTGIHIIIIPVVSVGSQSTLRYGTYKCHIAALASRGFHGFLGRQNGELVWETSAVTSDGPGLKVNQSQIFNIDLSMINSNEAWMTLRYDDMKIVKVRRLQSDIYDELSKTLVYVRGVGGVNSESKKCDFHVRIN